MIPLNRPRSARSSIAARIAIPCIALVGCSALPATIENPAGQPEATENLSANRVSGNGLSTNAFSTNGLSTNGLSTNGLSTNGLSTNGLSSATFGTWFNSNPPSTSDAVMKYVVLCSLASGKSLTYKSSAGVSYTWPGLFNLAPIWAAGSAAVVNVAGCRSGARPAHLLNAAPVPSPITATFARTSRGEASRAESISTVARLVSVIQANSPAASCFSAVVSAALLTGSSSMAGATMARAPRRIRILTSTAD